jgi:hypothetical protein
MTYIRTHYSELYTPRTISKSLFRSLVEGCDQFKPGLNTISRIIKARAISHAKITDIEGPQSWKVIDSHSLPELELLQVELLLVANTKDSCELHIEFRAEHIFLSVSDIQTGWGKAVFEEARYMLNTLGISSRGWKNVLKKAYAVLEIIQNLLMIFAVTVFYLWSKYNGKTYLYASFGLFISGVIPTLRRLYYFFSPPKKVLIIQETPPQNLRFPWVEAAAIFSLLASILSLAKEIISVFAAK